MNTRSYRFVRQRVRQKDAIIAKQRAWIQRAQACMDRDRQYIHELHMKLYAHVDPTVEQLQQEHFEARDRYAAAAAEALRERNEALSKLAFAREHIRALEAKIAELEADAVKRAA